MKTIETNPSVPEADLRAVIDAVASGRPVPPDVAKRVQDQAEQVRKGLRAASDNFSVDVNNFSVDVIREMRGPLDEEQERELTLSQRDILHNGDGRLVDPDTGEVYVLVREADYQRLASK